MASPQFLHLLEQLHKNRLIDGMQDDLEAGRSRELPPEQETMTHELPF